MAGMITQFRMRLDTAGTALTASDAYRLYAALLELAPADFGEQVHEGAITPISQHLRYDGGRSIWTVNLLGETAETALAPALARCETLQLHALNTRLRITERRERHLADADALFAAAAHREAETRLRFVTPTVFKSRGTYVLLPSTRLILQSLMKTWNGVFPDCPIEDEDGEGLAAMAEGLRVSAFSLRDSRFRMKGQSIPGFVGSITLENRLGGFHRQLADALLYLAPYTGVGAKTTLGMGGVEPG